MPPTRLPSPPPDANATIATIYLSWNLCLCSSLYAKKGKRAKPIRFICHDSRDIRSANTYLHTHTQETIHSIFLVTLLLQLLLAVSFYLIFFCCVSSNFGWLIVEHSIFSCRFSSFFRSCVAFAAFSYSRVYYAFDTTYIGVMELWYETELCQNKRVGPKKQS